MADRAGGGDCGSPILPSVTAPVTVPVMTDASFGTGDGDGDLLGGAVGGGIGDGVVDAIAGIEVLHRRSGRGCRSRCRATSDEAAVGVVAAVAACVGKADRVVVGIRHR